MNLDIKYSILLGIFIFTGLFATTPYGQNIVHTINIIHEDKFTPFIKKKFEQASEEDMQEFLQTVVKRAQKNYPIEISNDEVIIDLSYSTNKLIYVKKVNYRQLLNLKNINQDKEKITNALSIEMINTVCSQKLTSYMVVNKNISIEYKFNNWNMKLIDDIIVNKRDCVEWHKNNQTYTLINVIFELFKH